MKYISAAANIDYTVEKLNPYIETLLYDTLLPFFYITEKDVERFDNDPVEYILTMFDVTDSPRAQTLDLLYKLTRSSSIVKRGAETVKKTVDNKPDYLKKFLEFAVKNLEDYDAQIKASG